MPNLPSRPNWHGFYQVEDPHGRWWRNLRAHYWAGFGGTSPDGEPRWSVHVGGEWTHLHPTLRRLRLKVSTTGEETLDVAYGLGPLAQHYWSLVLDGPGDPVTKGGRTHWRRRQLRLPPLRFDLEVGVTGASWCLGADDGSWSTEAPLRERLRRGHATWWRYAARYRRGDPEVVAEADAEVLLPEGAYPLHVKLEREVRQARLGPLWLLRAPPGRRRDRWRRGPSVWLPWGRRVGWTATWEAPDGLPHPGKGENSWDCGQDRVYASGVPVRPYDPPDREWVAAAVAHATGVVLRDRVRYGSGMADTGA